MGSGKANHQQPKTSNRQIKIQRKHCTSRSRFFRRSTGEYDSLSRSLEQRRCVPSRPSTTCLAPHHDMNELNHFGLVHIVTVIESLIEPPCSSDPMSTPSPTLISINDYCEEARKKLPKMVNLCPSASVDFQVYDYYRSGARDEISLRRNELAFQNLLLKPRVLQDVFPHLVSFFNCCEVSSISLQTRTLGLTISTPICVAATAMHRMASKGRDWFCISLLILQVGRLTRPELVRKPVPCLYFELLKCLPDFRKMLSSLSTTSLEDVADAYKSASSVPQGQKLPLWFQLYVLKVL